MSLLCIRAGCLEAVRAPGDIAKRVYHSSGVGHDDPGRHCPAVPRDTASFHQVRLSAQRSSGLEESILRRRVHLSRMVHV